MVFTSKLLTLLAEHMPEATLEDIADVLRVAQFFAACPGRLLGEPEGNDDGTLLGLQKRVRRFVEVANEVGLFEDETTHATAQVEVAGE